jgi:ribonuclease R
MLPPILSEDYCSLKPKSKRLSFTCEMHFNKYTDLIDYKIYKSIIHLGKRFTYDDAEKHLENPKSPLYGVWQLAKALHKKRVSTGKIELNIKEMNMEIDAHGRILAINEKAKLLSHRLVEECMLSANSCTAHYMKKHKLPGLYRVHEPMPAGGLEKINAFFKLYGIKFQMKSLHFQQVQKAIEVVKNTSAEEVFNYILLRSFSQAVYKNMPMGHWGLGFTDYTHFTSPIRRFSDLVVHRVLDAHIHHQPLPYDKNQIESIGGEVSRLERVAMDAEKTMTRLISLRYFRDKVGGVFEAFLSGFNPHNLYIQLTNPRVEGVILPTAVNQRGDIQIVDDFRVKIARFSKTVNLGQKMKVRLVQADWEKIQLVFEIISLDNVKNFS